MTRELHQRIPQRPLGHQSPIQALKAWREKKSELFVKRVYEQAELDNYPQSYWLELIIYILTDGNLAKFTGCC